MKKLYHTIIVFLVAVSPVLGQHAGTVITSNASMDRYGDSICVTFVLNIDKQAVARTNTLVLSPVITDHVNDVSLPPVVVRGGKRAEITDRRHDWAGGGKIVPTVFAGQAVTAQRGEIMRYTVLTRYEPWMDDAELLLETIHMGCCREPHTETVSLRGRPTERIDWPVDPVPAVAATAFHAVDDETAQLCNELTADPHAGFSLQADTEEFIPSTTVVPLEEVSSEAVYDSRQIIFRKGSSRIERNLESNGSLLDGITAAVRELYASPDLVLDRIYITGYSSPDGPLASNERLAYARAAALRDYIQQTFGLPDEKFVLRNGGEDWEGLRELVAASDIPMRGRILDIITMYRYGTATAGVWGP